jgi:hypothetical protein
MDKLTGIREEIEDYREWAQIIGGHIPTRSIVDNKLSSVDSRMLDAGGEKLAAAADTIERLLALFSSQDSGSSPDHAPPAGSVASGWQPIDSAPTDRRVEVLLIARYPNGETWSDTYHSWAQAPYGGDWATHWARWPHSFGPTHWMPLPAPPSSATLAVSVTKMSPQSDN